MMIRVSTAILILAIAFGGCVDANAGISAATMNCAIGPQKRIFGKQEWLLYGCVGATAAVLVTPNGSPAFPFYFAIFRDRDGYRIVGEGTGNKNASDAALKDLKELTAEALADLICVAGKPKQ